MKYVLKFGALAFLALLLANISACKKDVAGPAECPDSISFAVDIKPIIEVNCSTSGCHDASSAQGGYNLEAYSGISAGADKILEAIRHEGPSPMPLGSPKLADSISQQFACWISQGKLDN